MMAGIDPNGPKALSCLKASASGAATKMASMEML
jgi:hypothetical protein